MINSINNKEVAEMLHEASFDYSHDYCKEIYFNITDK